MAYEITAGMVYEAIVEGVREATAEALKTLLESGNAKVQLSGSTMDLRGLHSERPAPSPENRDKTYWSVDTGEVAVSTGTAWRSLGVV